MHSNFITARFVVQRRDLHHVPSRLRKYRQQTGVGARSAVVVARQLLPAGRQKLDNRIEIVRTGRHADHVALVTRECPHPGITLFILVHGNFIGAAFVVGRRHPHHIPPRLRKYRQQTGVGTRFAIVARQLLPVGRQKLDNRIEIARTGRHADHVALASREHPYPRSHRTITSKITPDRLVHCELRRPHLLHPNFIAARFFTVEGRHPYHVPSRLRKYRQQTGVGARSAVVVARQLLPAGRQKLDNRIEIVRTGRHADHVALASREHPHSGNGAITSKVTPDRLVHR